MNTNTTKYIVSGREVIAMVAGDAKAGACRYAYLRCREAIDANREFNLVNARRGRVTSAKWAEKEVALTGDVDLAVELNPGEFFVKDAS